MKWVQSKICLADSTCTSKSFFFCPKRGQCGKWKQKNIMQMAWQRNVFQFLAYKPPTYVLVKNVITVTCRGAFYLSINLLLTSYTCACHVHTESLHGQHLDKLDFWSGTYGPNLKAEEIMGLESLITKEVIYQTRETVFHRDIQTPRRELKIRRAAEYFWRNSRCLDSRWNTVSSVWYIFSIETKTKE